MMEANRTWRTFCALALGLTVTCGALEFALAQPTPPAGPAFDEEYQKPWMDEVFGCRLTARTVDMGPGFREPLLVEVELKNVSGVPQHISWRNDGGYAFRVTDQLDDPVPLTRYARQLRGEVPAHPRHGSVGGSSLYPGQSMRDIIVLNQFCDLSMHGTYSVTVGKRIGKGVDFVTLKAPPLTLRVGMPGYGLSAQVQRLALSEAPERREDVLKAIGEELRRGIDLVKKSARDDESETVRAAARKVLADVRKAAAEGAAPEQPGPQMGRTVEGE